MKEIGKTFYLLALRLLVILFLFMGLSSGNDSSSTDLPVSDSLGIMDSTMLDTLESDSLSADSLSHVRDSIPNQLNRFIPNEAFGVGEKLTFAVRYGFVTAGYATMEVKDLLVVQDSFPAYHIVSTARSTRTFDIFFKVRDRVESVLDAHGIFSWGFKKILREGGYKYDLLVDYDQIYGKAYVEAVRYYDEEPLQVKEREKFELDIPKYVIDILGAFYYVRTQTLRPGMPVRMLNHDNKKIYNLTVIVQKKEQIKVRAGKFNCIVVQPRLKGDAIFKQKGKLWVWLTDDELKIPVQMKSKAFIGSVITELVDIEGVNRPISARVK